MKKILSVVCFLLAMTVVVAQSSKTFTVEGFSFKMIYVEGGTFTMGCTSEQTGCESDEKPAHEVTVGNFYMGETEVTQLLWRLVMGCEPTAFGGWTDEFGVGSMNPAYRVSWDECQQFCEKLNHLISHVITSVCLALVCCRSLAASRESRLEDRAQFLVNKECDDAVHNTLYKVERRNRKQAKCSHIADGRIDLCSCGNK